MLFQNGEAIDLAKGAKYIFVLDHQNRFYGGLYQKGVFHHTSFFAGAAVKAPGEWDIQKGCLSQIVDKTGHYNDDLPRGSDLRMYQVVKQLQLQGVDLRQVEAQFNVHPTALFTPFRYNAQNYLEENWTEHDWYYGKISENRAIEVLLQKQVLVLVRQREYLVPMENRKLTHNLLPIAQNEPSFEMMWLGEGGAICRQDVSLQGNSEHSSLLKLVETKKRVLCSLS